MSLEKTKHGIQRIRTKRKERKKESGTGIDDTLTRLKIYDKTRGCCYYCGVKLKYKLMTIDHVLPKHKGGMDKIENLVPACWKCNQDKAHLTLEQYRQRAFGDVDEKFYGETI